MITPIKINDTIIRLCLLVFVCFLWGFLFNNPFCCGPCRQKRAMTCCPDKHLCRLQSPDIVKNTHRKPTLLGKSIGLFFLDVSILTYLIDDNKEKNNLALQITNQQTHPRPSFLNCALETTGRLRLT